MLKYFVLIWAGLWRKKARTLLTFFSIVTAFFLFGMLQGINLGVDSLIGQFMDTSRLRISNRANRAGVMPLAHVTRIQSMEGVANVTPLVAVVGTFQDPKNVLVSLAVDVDAWMKIYPEFKVPAEQLSAMRTTRNGAIIGAATAKKYGLRVGDKLRVQSFNVPNSDGTRNWEFSVVGVYDLERAPEFSTNPIVHYEYVNEARAAQKNTAMQIIVRAVNPNKFAVLAPAIDEKFANSPDQTLTQNEKDFIQSTMAQVGDIGFFVNGVVGAVLFTLLFLTANTMMQSVRERVPEIAVLKTLGYSDGFMIGLVLIESLLLIAIAAATGLMLASAFFPVLMGILGSQVGLEGLRIPLIVFGWGAVFTLVLALAAGFPPAWRARRLKIVDALAGR